MPKLALDDAKRTLDFGSDTSLALVGLIQQEVCFVRFVQRLTAPQPWFWIRLGVSLPL